MNRSRLLQILLVLFGLVAFFFIGYVMATPPSKATPSIVVSPTPISGLDTYKLYDLINSYRASKGLDKLKFNPAMCSYTLLRLSEVGSDWSHDGFMGNLPFWNHYYSNTAGENLAKGYPTESDTFMAWYNSPEHIVNILNPNYTDTCIVVGSSPSNYVVQEFSSSF